MDNSMEFPKDWRVFLNEYSFRDEEQAYTNGCLLIPTYRAEQLIEHLLKEHEGSEKMKKLKPCPFCGSDAKTFVDYDRVGSNNFDVSAYVKCSKCGVYKRRSYGMKDGSFDDWEALFETVTNFWNERA